MEPEGKEGKQPEGMEPEGMEPEGMEPEGMEPEGKEKAMRPKRTGAYAFCSQVGSNTPCCSTLHRLCA